MPTLQYFVDIKHIPKAYGGELEWKWGDRPNLDPAIREAVAWEDGLTDFPEGPMYWRPAEGDKFECIAVGSVKQVDRLQKVGTLPRSWNAQSAAPPSTSTEQVLETAQVPETAGVGAGAAASESGEATVSGETHPIQAIAAAAPVDTDVAEKDEGRTMEKLAIADNEKDVSEVSEKLVVESAAAQATVA